MTYGSDFNVMLLSHDFFAGFLPSYKSISDNHKVTGSIHAIELDSREVVDVFFEKIIQAGGKKTIETYDYGFMYGRNFEDLDGHIWEVFWMDVSQMPKE